MKTLVYFLLILVLLKIMGFINLSWFWILFPVVLPVSLVSLICLIILVGTTIIVYNKLK
jgi:hypothetical protein